MTTQTRQERADFCDLLDQLGPDQPTLCQGWQTRDLVAHLLIRERRPLAAPGIALKPLAGYTARVQRSLAQRPFAELVAMLRQPPRWSPMRLAPVDRAVNTLELFIHHEDVRRAQPEWQPRQLPPQLAALLWSRVRIAARLLRRRFPAPVELAAPGYGVHPSGRAHPQVRVTGEPGELVLFFTGRQRAARVELAGPEPLTSALASVQLGI